MYHGCSHSVGQSEGGTALGRLCQLGVGHEERGLVAGVHDVTQRQQRGTQPHCRPCHHGDQQLGERNEATYQLPKKHELHMSHVDCMRI